MVHVQRGGHGILVSSYSQTHRVQSQVKQLEPHNQADHDSLPGADFAADFSLDSLSRKQFQLLELILFADAPFTQRELARVSGFSLGAVNKVVRELEAVGLVKDGFATDFAIELLRPCRAVRALILATDPKSVRGALQMIDGKRSIDHLIDTCVDSKIREIRIVRHRVKNGHKLDCLVDKYPMIRFIDFDDDHCPLEAIAMDSGFMSCALVARADLLLPCPSLVRKIYYRSTIWGNRNEKGSWKPAGLSFWNEADGKALVQAAREACESGRAESLGWDRFQLEFADAHPSVELREFPRVEAGD